MTQAIDGSSESCYGYDVGIDELEDKHVSSKQSYKDAFVNLKSFGDRSANLVKPLMSRCTKVDFDFTVSVEDKHGNKAEGSVHVSAQGEQSSGSNKSSSSKK